MRLLSVLIFIVFSLFEIQVFAADSCREIFKGSLREAQSKAVEKNHMPELWPKFKSLLEEVELEKKWRTPEKSSKEGLAGLLPEEVFFIDRVLRESRRQNVVKLPAQGNVLIARGRYHSQGQDLETNITFSQLGLKNNISEDKKWLIGPSAKAAILFLHGGGTKSTGGHVAEGLINQLHKYEVAVISPDLPWHGEGPRTFMGDLDQEMQALSDLAVKYVHPDVPLFVWGHSWGGSFAHKIMQMSGEREEGFFHKNLKGLVITSPAVDFAPGKNLKDKMNIYMERMQKALKDRENEIAPVEKDFPTLLVSDGKTSPIGQFFASITTAQLDDKESPEKEKNYLPSLMLVGKWDQLVFLGFEDLFHNYYDRLENVETHYMDKLPLLHSKDKTETHKVGHLLSDYALTPESTMPANFELGLNFISKQTGKQLQPKKEIQNPTSLLLHIVQLWANDLSFREWAETAVITKNVRSPAYIKMQKDMEQKRNHLSKTLLPSLHFRNNLYSTLKEFSEQLSADPSLRKYKLTRVQERVRSFEPFVIQNEEIKGAFVEFLKAEDNSSAQTAVDKLLKSRYLSQPGKAEVSRFVKEMSMIKDFTALKKAWRKHPYISKQQLKTIFPVMEDLVRMENLLNSSYIPRFEDFKSKRPGLSNHEIAHNIFLIKENIKKRDALFTRVGELNKDINRLKTKMYFQLDLIEQQSKQIREVFNSATVNPPESLRKEYEESEKELSELFALSEKMDTEVEELAYESLEKKKLNIDELSKILAPYQETIETFNEKYELFIKNRKKLREKLIQVLQKGEFSEEAQKLAGGLYGKIGLHSETEALSVQLAKRESEKMHLVLKINQLLREYNDLIPFDNLTEIREVKVYNILNDFEIDSDFLEKNKSLFQGVLRAWKELGSHIPPELPD